ncbi:MAG: ankyrin repeat domain-containing protein [Phycisphaerales bacterium JB063]
MQTLAEKLVAIAKAVEPSEGYFGYLDFVDALEADPSAMSVFRTLLEVAKAEDLDSLDEVDDKYGWIVGGAADALDLLPDDPRNFMSEGRANLLEDSEVLGTLCGACIVNDVETVRRLVKRANVNSLDHNKQLPLMYAAGNNHPDCVRILLDHGADPNKVQNWGNTPMHCCNSKTVFRMLLDAGGRTDIKNDRGETVVDELELYGRLDWLDE